jgi:zinc transport system substrate-binding protein
MIKKLPLVLPVALAVSSAHSLELTATVAPIASLVEQVAGQPVQILIPASESPHYFNMRMSQRALIEQSDLVFWVGESLETPMAEALSKMPNAVSLTDQDTELHGEHDHEAHDHEAHDHEAHDHEGHDHEAHDHEAHDHDDSHPWLSIEESEHLLNIIAAELSRIDSANQGEYETRAQQAIERLDALEAGLKSATAPMKSVPYWVMHDAYRPFEADMGIRRTGVIQANVNVKPTAKELANLRQQVQGGGCIFNEPQMDARWIDLVAKESNVSVHTLDPLGTELASGPELHTQLLESIAASFAACADSVTQ